MNSNFCPILYFFVGRKKEEAGAEGTEMPRLGRLGMRVDGAAMRAKRRIGPTGGGSEAKQRGRESTEPDSGKRRRGADGQGTTPTRRTRRHQRPNQWSHCPP